MNSKTKTKLSRLHWYVYYLITDKPYTSTNPIEQWDIYDHCKQQGFDVTWSVTQNQHNDHCRWLNRIVEDLNNSMEVDKIIHHHGYRYYVCTYEEAELLCDLRHKRIVLASMRISRIRKKIRRHNQGKLLTNRGDSMEGSQAKPFHEAFPEESQ